MTTVQDTSPIASRAAGLERLNRFVPLAGRTYASERNYDRPNYGHPNVSQLSPYLRHRLITEDEVVDAVLAHHSGQAAEKFIQEVFWRTYWKGWLEMRASVWGSYASSLHKMTLHLDKDADLNDAVERAETGQTDIDAFNAWAHELVATGYLHNHARMWFASIWIFTLRLPWELGADFFMRHLLDGDPASNTLSWRWVAGLQTQGKHYLARSSNISKYTEGRHNPEWRLNTQADPLAGAPHPSPKDIQDYEPPQPGLRTVVLVHEDDLSPAPLLDDPTLSLCGMAGLLATNGRSPRPVSDQVSAFAEAAVRDCHTRWHERCGDAGPVTSDLPELADWIASRGAEQVIVPYAPVGPTAKALRGLEARLSDADIPLYRVMKRWDLAAWPYATKGFFKFKSAIPGLIG